ncbi:J domain-containing protein [Leeia aquatica]|uniref:J domain-containing protein n=1 Tax=Leeia aquatica TaxID=2725557 RepID=A0A847RRF5_9NEIS|nr:J domain-containing protein [Leeia aquatica]NLR73810.1 J domain-containing protein [Leeia aquatica]
MSRCWEILGIEATSDTRLIKRAYAKLLKVNRPEDDAEAFQRLRDAHDEALARAAWMLEEEEEGEAELVESATQEAPLGSPVTPLGEDVIRNEFAATLEEDPPPADADERIELHSADSTTTLGQWYQQVLALLEQPEALLSALNEIWTDPRLQLSLGQEWERSLLYLCAQNPACLPLLLAVDAHYGWREGRSELPLYHHQAWVVLRKQLLLCEVSETLSSALHQGTFKLRMALRILQSQCASGLEEYEWLEEHVATVLCLQASLSLEVLNTVFEKMGWEDYPSHLPKSSRQQIEYLYSMRREAQSNADYEVLISDWRAHAKTRLPWGRMHQQQVMQSLFYPVPRWRLKLWALNHKAQLFAEERIEEIEQFPKPFQDMFNQRGIAFWREKHAHLGQNPVMSLSISCMICFFLLFWLANGLMLNHGIAGLLPLPVVLSANVILAIISGFFTALALQRFIRLNRALVGWFVALDEDLSERWINTHFPRAYASGWRVLLTWRSVGLWGVLGLGAIVFVVRGEYIGKLISLVFVGGMFLFLLYAIWGGLSALWAGGLRIFNQVRAEQGSTEHDTPIWLFVMGGLVATVLTLLAVLTPEHPYRGAIPSVQTIKQACEEAASASRDRQLGAVQRCVEQTRMGIPLAPSSAP